MWKNNNGIVIAPYFPKEGVSHVTRNNKLNCCLAYELLC